MNIGDYFYSPYVGCSVATISRELSRNKSKTRIYSPKIAQEMIENNIPMLGKQLSINSFTKTKKTETTYTNTLVISLSIVVEHCTLVKRK